MAPQGLQPFSAHHANRISPTLQARLHNFVKHALLQQLVHPGSTVCDLYCGQGMDTGKWAQAQIGRYVGVDLATSILDDAREQWNSLNRPYPADFCEADPSVVNLETELRYMGLPADFVTCMGRLQDSFFREEMVKSLLQNVASILKPGGYFFGITADSSTIWSKFQKAVEGAHRAGVFRSLPRVHSEHYIISFEDDRFTPFGTRYTLQFADGVVFEGQQLVHFPSFIRLAEEAGLEYVELQNLQEFYDDYRLHFQDLLRATCANLVDPKGRLPQFAHDILSLYTTFIFKKAECLEPDYISSPYPIPDEEQLEMCSEETVDGNRAPFQDIVLPVKEINAAPKLVTTAFQQIELREASHPRLDEDKRLHSLVLHTQEVTLISPRDDTCKEIMNVVNSSCGAPQADSECHEELKLDTKELAEGLLSTGKKGSNEVHTSDKCMELVEAALIGASGVVCDSQAVKDLQACIEGSVLSFKPSEASTRPTLKSGSPQNEILQLRDEDHEPATSHVHVHFRDDETEEPLTTTDDVLEEICDEAKSQSFSETPGHIENASNMQLSIPQEEDLKRGNADTLPKDPSPVAIVVPSKSVADLEIEEVKARDLQSDDVANEMPKQSEGTIHKDVQSMASPRKDDGDHSIKRGPNSSTREETHNSFNKRLNTGGSEHHHRSGRSHHHHVHSSRKDEKQDHSHGSRHHSHGSVHKGMRDRTGEHKSELSSPPQRGDGRRGRGRSRSAAAVHAHTPAPAPAPAPNPAFFQFGPFIPQPEYPIFQSPNTPGILGPGPPPVLLIEPFHPLWPIPPPLERRPFPKTRAHRKHGNDRESTGSRSNRRDSPKRHWKDSPPPPGTES